jgi:hypothetical protein
MNNNDMKDWIKNQIENNNQNEGNNNSNNDNMDTSNDPEKAANMKMTSTTPMNFEVDENKLSQEEIRKRRLQRFQEDPKKESPKKEEPKKEETPKKEESKKEEPKKEETPKKEEPQIEMKSPQNVIKISPTIVISESSPSTPLKRTSPEKIENNNSKIQNNNLNTFSRSPINNLNVTNSKSPMINLVNFFFFLLNKHKNFNTNFFWHSKKNNVLQSKNFLII